MLSAEQSSTDDFIRGLPVDDDQIALSYIADEKILDFELGLFATKWFDYRHLTPVQATRRFIQDYGVVYKDIYAREMDRERAEHVKPYDLDRLLAGLAENDPKWKKVFKACWKARQVADALGMPYSIYLEWAFTYRMRRWQQAYLPQPQHLYQEYDVEKIQEKWEELQGSIIFLSDHPAYLIQNYDNIAYQNDHHEWLFKQANLRADPYYHLARFIDQDLLPVDKVRARLEPYLFERVEQNLQ